MRDLWLLETQFCICKCVHYVSGVVAQLTGREQEKKWPTRGLKGLWNDTVIPPKPPSSLSSSIERHIRISSTCQTISYTTSQFHFRNIITLSGHVREHCWMWPFRCHSFSPVHSVGRSASWWPCCHPHNPQLLSQWRGGWFYGRRRWRVREWVNWPPDYWFTICVIQKVVSLEGTGTNRWWRWR